jgi:23S rRNA (guanosine2251-2'-O)-methyltransferase
VRETLLKTPDTLCEIWVGVSRKGARAEEIARLAGERGVPVQFKELREIDVVAPGPAHQGFVAFAEAFSYADLEDLIGKSRQVPGGALLIVADHITDEGNLGALIRTLRFSGRTV